MTCKMERSNQAWIIPFSEDEQVSSFIGSNIFVERCKARAFTTALVAPNVEGYSRPKLRKFFDYIMLAEGVTDKAPFLETRDALLLQCLRFSLFSNVVVIDPLFHQISDQNFDNPGVLLNRQGEWKSVAFRPDVSIWKTIVDAMANSERKWSSKEFMNAFGPHFGGIVNQSSALLELDIGYDGYDGKDTDMKRLLYSPPELNKLENDTTSWIAIVGMSCRFPAADSVEEYWEILKNGRNTSSYPSEERVILSNLGATVKANYLKCPINEFDAQFFGLSPSEAALTDVQARLLLEVSWEAFEDGGLNISKLRGTPVGIFHGSWTQDYKECLNNAQPSDQAFMRKYIGNGSGSTAAKLSFFYGFTGPNIATDSGCSSSMMAVELACKSLLQRECPVAVATGSNIILQLDLASNFLWAEDGMCKAFDANAKGYGRAEGAVCALCPFPTRFWVDRTKWTKRKKVVKMDEMDSIM